MENPAKTIRTRWSALLFCLFSAVVACGQTATHETSYFYTAPGTYTVTNVLYYPQDVQLTSLNWWPDVPTGWIITNLRGSNGPILYDYIEDYVFGWSGGPYPNPLVFYYDITIPAGVTGDQQIPSAFWFNTPEVPPTGYSQPDPLILHQPRSISGVVFHEEDNNGTYDTWDEPVTNITVLLLEGGTTNRLAAPAVTDVNGYYSFGYLPDGDYDVAFMVKTNQVTISPGGSDTNRNQLIPNSDKIVSVSIASATNVHINVGMTGEAPLSSEIAVRIFRCAEGIFLEFTTANEVERDDGTLLHVCRRLPDGTLLLLGMAAAQGEGSNNYSLRVAEGLLDLEGPNTIRIRDEVGHWHELSGIFVSDFKTSMAKMTKEGMRLTWNSLPDAYYDIYQATSPSGPWEMVAWEHALGSTCATTVPVYADKPTCFFKIVMRR